MDRKVQSSPPGSPRAPAESAVPLVQRALTQIVRQPSLFYDGRELPAELAYVPVLQPLLAALSPPEQVRLATVHEDVQLAVLGGLPPRDLKEAQDVLREAILSAPARLSSLLTLEAAAEAERRLHTMPLAPGRAQLSQVQQAIVARQQAWLDWCALDHLPSPLLARLLATDTPRRRERVKAFWPGEDLPDKAWFVAAEKTAAQIGAMLRRLRCIKAAGLSPSELDEVGRAIQFCSTCFDRLTADFLANFQERGYFPAADRRVDRVSPEFRTALPHLPGGAKLLHTLDNLERPPKARPELFSSTGRALRALLDVARAMPRPASDNLKNGFEQIEGADVYYHMEVMQAVLTVRGFLLTTERRQTSEAPPSDIAVHAKNPTPPPLSEQSAEGFLGELSTILSVGADDLRLWNRECHHW